ncbi:hypothetical protein HZF05_01440 [Sphingomonas sp. CGMCC 1.13654]|uniref:Uncharacterized protein n=1 Tax=Sphingomonas chungangi TaxID=2683589 RepID=A0A838L539_9SPHN|nr:hypothetical protein [Sphingomonas chungangi]MBA2932748.1 hypothetical protein [Sphingomonas chungangi]MVW56370.1 hypothetical protein [Sphingomonas chungangi]
MISLLLGLAVAGPALSDAAAHQTVYLSWDAEAKACHARVGSIEIGDPTTDDGEAALNAALSDRQRAVQLQGLSNAVPYTCVDSVLSTLRKSGHTIKVGFLSEPAGR